MLFISCIDSAFGSFFYSPEYLGTLIPYISTFFSFILVGESAKIKLKHDTHIHTSRILNIEG